MSHLTAILSLSSLQGEVSEHVSAVDNWNDEDDEDSDTSDSSEQRLKEAAQVSLLTASTSGPAATCRSGLYGVLIAVCHPLLLVVSVCAKCTTAQC